MRIRSQELLPHRPEINQVARLAEILLGRLDLRYGRRLLKSAEQRLGDYTREHGHYCVCRLVHVEEGQRLSEDVQAQVEINLQCFERYKHARCKFGFSTVIVAPLSQAVSDYPRHS